MVPWFSSNIPATSPNQHTRFTRGAHRRFGRACPVVGGGPATGASEERGTSLTYLKAEAHDLEVMNIGPWIAEGSPGQDVVNGSNGERIHQVFLIHLYL